MITDTQWKRLHKILGQGPWESPAEFIYNAFAKNSNIQTPPPAHFNSLSDAEYDVIMSYGISEISKIKATACNKPITVEYDSFFDKHPNSVVVKNRYPDSVAVKNSPHTEPAEGMPYIHPDTPIKFTNIHPDTSITFTTDLEAAPDIRITPPAKKTRPIRGEYVSIWDRPLLTIEDSLTTEDEDIQPLEGSLPRNVYIEKSPPQNIHKLFFDIPTEDNESAPTTDPVDPSTLSVEKSEKLLKALLNHYEGQSKPEKKLTMEKDLVVEKTTAALAKFKVDTPPDSQIE